MRSNRISWVDSAKGLGIILVVLGHTSLPQEIKTYIYSFHMPLFFFLSGVVFNEKKNFSAFLKGKLKGIVIPYFIISIITYIFWILVTRHIGANSAKISIFKPIIGMFYSTPAGTWLAHNVFIWFLTTLFVVEISFYFVNKLVNNKLLKIIILLLFSIIGYLYAGFSFRLPWGIDIAFTAIVFYGAGFLVKNYVVDNIRISKPYYLVVMVISLVLSVFTSQINGYIDLSGLIYKNYFLLYISAFCGITFWILLAKLVAQSKVMKFIGKNSIVYFSFQGIALGICNALIVFIAKIPIVSTEKSLYWGIVFTIFSLCILTAGCFIINNYLPWIIGKNKSKAIKHEISLNE